MVFAGPSDNRKWREGERMKEKGSQKKTPLERSASMLRKKTRTNNPDDYRPAFGGLVALNAAARRRAPAFLKRELVQLPWETGAEKAALALHNPRKDKTTK